MMSVTASYPQTTANSNTFLSKSGSSTSHYPLPSNMRTIGTTLATVGAALFLLCVFVPHYTVAVKLYAAKNPLVLVYDLPYGLH